MQPAENAVYKQLQKSFKVMDQSAALWQDSVLTSQPEVTSLCNLAEQLQCCQNVTVDGAVLGEFPDLHGRLCTKLVMALEAQTHTLLQTL